MNDKLFVKQFNSALKLREEKKYDEAIQVFLDLIKIKPSDTATFGMLAATYWDLGNLTKAIEYFQYAITLNEKSETASLGLYHTLWSSGRHEDALEEMKRFCSLQYSEEYNLILKELNESWDEDERDQ